MDSDLHIVANSPSAFDFKGMFHTNFPAEASTSHCGMPFSSTTLDGPSFIFSDGVSTSGVRPPQSCTWRISNAVVTFGRSSVYEGNLTVYDGDKILYKCTNCRDHVPTSFVVRDGGVVYDTLPFNSTGRRVDLPIGSEGELRRRLI